MTNVILSTIQPFHPTQYTAPSINSGEITNPDPDINGAGFNEYVNIKSRQKNEGIFTRKYYY